MLLCSFKNGCIKKENFNLPHVVENIWVYYDERFNVLHINVIHKRFESRKIWMKIRSIMNNGTLDAIETFLENATFAHHN